MTKKLGGFGKHTTTNELGANIIGYLDSLQRQGLGIKNIHIGSHEVLLDRADSFWEVKIYQESGALRLVCMQKASKQTIRVYTADKSSKQAVLDLITRYVRNNRWKLRFGKCQN